MLHTVKGIGVFTSMLIKSFRCCVVVTPAFLFREIRSPPGAYGMTFEKCYDWAKEEKREDIPRETPRIMTNTVSV